MPLASPIQLRPGRINSWSVVSMGSVFRARSLASQCFIGKLTPLRSRSWHWSTGYGVAALRCWIPNTSRHIFARLAQSKSQSDNTFGCYINLFRWTADSTSVHASRIIDDLRGMHAIVSIQNLTVYRGKTKILQNVNWEIESRDNWVLLEANGSGKTTLLSCITGYVTPSGGRIRVLDQEYGKTDWRELRKQVGLVSSSVRQMISDEQLGLDIVASGQQAVINSWKPARGLERKRAFRLLEQVECQKLADRPWAYFSQGERQRVLIGRALMANHKILILDEPCAGLDPVARERFLEFLQRLATQSTDYSPNLVLVTHHVEEILPCFSRALLLKGGKVLVEGPVRKAVSATNLSEAFGAELSIRFSGGRFQSRLRPV